MSVRYWILSTAPTVLTSIYQYCCLFKDQLDGIGVYPFQHTDPRTHISIKKIANTWTPNSGSWGDRKEIMLTGSTARRLRMHLPHTARRGHVGKRARSSRAQRKGAPGGVWARTACVMHLCSPCTPAAWWCRWAAFAPCRSMLLQPPCPAASAPPPPPRPTARCRRILGAPPLDAATPPGARPGHVARCRRGRRSHGAAALPLLAAAVAIWIEMRWGVGLGAGARGIGAWWAKLGRASLDRVWRGTWLGWLELVGCWV